MDKRTRRKRRINSRGKALLKALMDDRGWLPTDVERASERTGHPMRTVSYRTVYRVLEDGHEPVSPIQFEIAATFGLLPSHIWGAVPLPEPFAYLNNSMAMVA